MGKKTSRIDVYGYKKYVKDFKNKILENNALT